MMTSSTSRLNSQVSMDAAPSTPTAAPSTYRPFAIGQELGQSSVFVDAVAGPDDASRRNTASLMRYAAEQQGQQQRIVVPAHSGGQAPDNQHGGKANHVSMVTSQFHPDPDIARGLDLKLKSMEISSSYDDSSYGSLGSMEACSSTPSDDWLDELKTYEKEMPPEIRMGYLDVLILYHEDDREEAEVFRQHLMNEIDVENGPIKTMLYDDPEMVAICGSLIGHLDQAVQRSTYVFIYMTKTFVNDKWCEFQSESCLMEAITNPKKMWCVVPVYTEKRNKSFRVPMGLNTLKGINYYNNDKFYRKGVSRLIGDKINVRIQADKDHRINQKKWLEEYKRTQLQQQEMMRRVVAHEEERTRKAEEWIQQETEKLIRMGVLPSTIQHSASDYDIPKNSTTMHHSHSANSLKPIRPQNPAASQYFQDLLRQQENEGYNFAGYSNEELLHIQRVISRNPPLNSVHSSQELKYNYPQGQAMFPPVSNVANYAQNQHSVNRATSQSSSDTSLSNHPENRNTSDIPIELLKKIQHMPPNEQERWIREYNQTAMQHEQQNRTSVQPSQSSWVSVQQDMQNSVTLLTDQYNRSDVYQQMPAFDQLNSASSIGSRPSYRDESSSGSVFVTNVGHANHPVPSQTSYGSRPQTSVDGSQSVLPGNLPNVSLLGCSHETDGGSTSSVPSYNSAPVSRKPTQQENARLVPTNCDSDSDRDEKKYPGKKRKEKVVKHVTINVYQAQNVQIGDQNEIANMMAASSDDDDDDDDDEGKVTPEYATQTGRATTEDNQVMKKMEVSSGARSHAELGPQTTAVDAGFSTVPDIKIMSENPDIEPENNKSEPQHKTQHDTDIKDLTLLKGQTIEEGEEVKEDEENEETEVSKDKERLTNSSKIEAEPEQSSKLVEKSQRFEGSVNINSSESDKPTQSLQKDIQTFSTTKPVAKCRPQVALVSPIIHDPPNDNVDFTFVKAVVDSEYTRRKVPYSNCDIDDRSQTFVKQVAPARHVAPTGVSESVQSEMNFTTESQTNTSNSACKHNPVHEDIVNTVAPAERFSKLQTDPTQLFYSNARPRFNQLPYRHGDSAEGQRDTTLEAPDEGREATEEDNDFCIVNTEESALSQASSSFEESGNLQANGWRRRGITNNNKECCIS